MLRIGTNKITWRCPYCGGDAEMIDGGELHHTRAGQAHWICRACEAFTGSFKGTTLPKGPLANRGLRIARKHAFHAFDRIWQPMMRELGITRKEARIATVRWLSAELGEQFPVFIAIADEATCHRITEICEARAPPAERWRRIGDQIRLGRGLGGPADVAEAKQRIDIVVGQAAVS